MCVGEYFKILAFLWGMIGLTRPRDARGLCIAQYSSRCGQVATADPEVAGISRRGSCEALQCESSRGAAAASCLDETPLLSASVLLIFAVCRTVEVSILEILLVMLPLLLTVDATR